MRDSKTNPPGDQHKSTNSRTSDSTGPSEMTLRGVCFGFPGLPNFLGPIDLCLKPGDLWLVLGPNGSGKSTLLKLMAGLLVPSAGEIRVGNQDLQRLRHRRRAQWLAYLPQQPERSLDATVQETVLMGRFPHQSWGLFESNKDYRVAEEAMVRTGVLRFAHQSLSTLSGGEAQRVHMAAAIAQTTPILLLDEPAAPLDLRYQIEMLRLLKDLTIDRSHTVVAALHDVNLGVRFGSRAILLHNGQAAAVGDPQEVITPANLEPVLGLKLAAIPLGSGSAESWVVPR